MKFSRFALVLAASLFFLPGLACAGPADKISGPKARFAEAIHDFGQVDEGAILEHAFKISNQGDQPLTINNVSPT